MAAAPILRHQPIQHRPEFLARMARLKLEEPSGRKTRDGLKAQGVRKAQDPRKMLSIPCTQLGQYGVWDSSTMLMLCNPRCHQCGGVGHLSIKGTVQPCRCVLRQVFRRCYERWRVIEAERGGCSSATLERFPGRSGGQSYGRQKEEFAADFFLVSRRALADEPLLWQIFRLHVLRGTEWRLCTQQLRIDRGTYFHAVYEMEEKLGRVFHELRPYALHPVSDYFGKRIQNPVWSDAQ